MRKRFYRRDSCGAECFVPHQMFGVKEAACVCVRNKKICNAPHTQHPLRYDGCEMKLTLQLVAIYCVPPASLPTHWSFNNNNNNNSGHKVCLISIDLEAQTQFAIKLLLQKLIAANGIILILIITTTIIIIIILILIINELISEQIK